MTLPPCSKLLLLSGYCVIRPVEPTMFQRSLSTQIDEIIEYLKSIKLGQSPKLPLVRPTKLRSFQHSLTHS